MNGIIGLAPSATTTTQAQSFVFTGEFLLKLNNLFKSGKMVMINWKSFQARSQELKTAFNYPYILGQPIGADVAVDFLKFDTLYSNFNRQIGLQYYTSGINGFKVFYRVNSTNLISVDTTAVRNTEKLPSINSVQTSQYGLSANFNLLDYRFNPRKGWWIESTVSAGTKQILKDNRITSVKFGTAQYNLYDSTVLKTNQYQIKLRVDKFFPVGVKGTIKAGISIEQIIAPVIYFNEVMREGGINSLKGFNEQSIYATNFNMLDFEYRYLLGPNSYIKAFWNGAYYEDHTTGKNTAYDTPWGFGIGGNIETRAGILSILYALGKEKQNNFDLRAGKIHFGISSYFKKLFISIILALLLYVPCKAQQDSTASIFTFEETTVVPDSLLSGIDYYFKIRKQQQERILIDDLGQMALTITQDTLAYIDTIPKDTLTPEKFKGTDINIYRNSKANIRKSLLASDNPPPRAHMDNWFVMAWSFFILILLIIFKYSYPLQYYLINRAWYSSLSFREFYDTQTDIFKGSKFFAWFIISQVFSIGVFILIRVNFKDINYSDFPLAALVSSGVISIFILNQWMKFLFSFAFRQISLSKDYAIIFRINGFLITLILMPLILFVYYTNISVFQQSVGLILLIALLLIYGLSLLKFSFSGLFAETQSSLF